MNYGSLLYAKQSFLILNSYFIIRFSYATDSLTQRKRMKKVMVFGTFDRLHPGHEFVFREALKRGQVTVVVARSDNVKRIKGKLPMQPDDVRMDAIRKAFPDIRVILGDKDDFLSPVRKLKPDLILLGYDQKMPPNVQESDLSCSVERLAAFRPEEFKSSLMKKLK